MIPHTKNERKNIVECNNLVSRRRRVSIIIPSIKNQQRRKAIYYKILQKKNATYFHLYDEYKLSEKAYFLFAFYYAYNLSFTCRYFFYRKEKTVEHSTKKNCFPALCEVNIFRHSVLFVH